MPKFKVMIAQFPGTYHTHQDVADYAADLQIQLLQDPWVGAGNVARWRLTDTPITMGRNRCLDQAEEGGFDYVIMIDSDMSPDLKYSDAKPFWNSSWEFARNHNGPCVIAAPYCGPAPVEEVYAFKWAQTETGGGNPNFKVANYDRYDAAGYKGILPAAALATGLMLIDMRAVKRLPHPRFYYEWTNEKQTHKASTEDVTFSRDLYLRGVPLYVNWDAWAGHHKLKLVPRPERIPEGVVPKMLTERAEQIAIERLVKVASQVDPTTKKALSAVEFVGKYKPEAGYSEKQELAEDEDPKNISWPTTYIEDAKENGMIVRRKADSDTLVLESKPIPVSIKSGTLESAGEMDFNDKIFSPVAVKGSSHLGVKPGVLIPADLSAMEIIQSKKPKSYSVDSENTVEYFSYEKIVPPESNEVNPEEDPINEVL